MQLKTSVETTSRITGSSDAQGKTLGEKSISDALGLASGMASKKTGYLNVHCKHREKVVEKLEQINNGGMYPR